ncbi:MAG: DUF427 domain-containing protein, partial [Acidimicrobiales bacterium]
FGHPRDPFHRVDARRSSRHVVVRVHESGEVLAEGDRPVALNETGLPTRWYLPLGDVRKESLVPSDTETVCPYKGVATYWSVSAAGHTFTDAVWTYREPLPEATPVAEYVCFMADGITTEVS